MKNLEDHMAVSPASPATTPMASATCADLWSRCVKTNARRMPDVRPRYRKRRLRVLSGQAASPLEAIKVFLLEAGWSPKEIVNCVASYLLRPVGDTSPIPRIARWLEDVPKRFRKMVARVLNGQESPRVAIKVRCSACMGWSDPHVANCTSSACPLYRMRPYQAASTILPSGREAELELREAMKDAGDDSTAG